MPEGIGVWTDTYILRASYREAVDLTLINPDLDPTDAIIATRRGRTKYGYDINVEQESRSRSACSGAGAGTTARTRSLPSATSTTASVGASIKGNVWSRPEDRIGLAIVTNGLSQDHRDYIAAGGARHPDRRRQVERPAGKYCRDLLCHELVQGCHADIRLSVPEKSGV